MRKTYIIAVLIFIGIVIAGSVFTITKQFGGTEYVKEKKYVCSNGEIVTDPELCPSKTEIPIPIISTTTTIIPSHDSTASRYSSSSSSVTVRKNYFTLTVSPESPVTGQVVRLTVKDKQTSDEVKDADVDIHFDGRKVFYGRTNNEGIFEFTPKEAGSYEIIVDKTRYREEKKTVTVSEGATTLTNKVKIEKFFPKDGEIICGFRIEQSQRGMLQSEDQNVFIDYMVFSDSRDAQFLLEGISKDESKLEVKDILLNDWSGKKYREIDTYSDMTWIGIVVTNGEYAISSSVNMDEIPNAEGKGECIIKTIVERYNDLQSKSATK